VTAEEGPLDAPLDPARFGTLRRLAEDPARRFVVSLGGGSVPALCGNTMLLALLEDLGLREHVDEVWGTSAGAVIGAAWASGVPVKEIVSLGKEIARPRILDVPRARIAAALLLKPFGATLPDGLVRGRRIREALAGMIRVERIEDCPIPFRCIAVTDDGTLRRTVFRRGRIVPAVYASLSVPGVMMPGEPPDGEEVGFLDGGIAEKTPVLSPIAEHRRIGDGRSLMLLSTRFGGGGKRTPPRGFLRRFLHAVDALESLAWSYQLAEARAQPGVSVLVLDAGIDDTRLFDFARIDRNLAQARAALTHALQDARIAASLGAG
jgi:predicted acylesterase/phospholipase RssA